MNSYLADFEGVRADSDKRKVVTEIEYVNGIRSFLFMKSPGIIHTSFS